VIFDIPAGLLKIMGFKGFDLLEDLKSQRLLKHVFQREQPDVILNYTILTKLAARRS
jgi:hypothetical protein